MTRRRRSAGRVHRPRGRRFPERPVRRLLAPTSGRRFRPARLDLPARVSRYRARRTALGSRRSCGRAAARRPRWQKRLADDGKLTVHFNQALSASQVRGVTTPRRSTAYRRPQRAARPVRRLPQSRRVRAGIDVDTVKIFCDGVPEFPGQTAAMLQPYRVNVGTPENPQWVPGTRRGEEPSCEDGTLGFSELDAAKWNIHCTRLGIAPCACRSTTSRARRREPPLGLGGTRSPTCSSSTTKDLPRFGELGVVASMSLSGPAATPGRSGHRGPRRPGGDGQAVSGRERPARRRGRRLRQRLARDRPDAVGGHRVRRDADGRAGSGQGHLPRHARAGLRAAVADPLGQGVDDRRRLPDAPRRRHRSRSGAARWPI